MLVTEVHATPAAFIDIEFDSLLLHRSQQGGGIMAVLFKGV
jgi:hypothetical protein